MGNVAAPGCPADPDGTRFGGDRRGSVPVPLAAAFVPGRPSPRGLDLVYGARVTPTCLHLDLVMADLPPGLDVCPSCVGMGSRWLHLRQCLVCGATACCDSSPNRHATAHVRGSGHPLIRSLEDGEDWSFCYVDEETLRRPDGAWIAVDPFFDAGLWYAGQRIEQGVPLEVGPEEMTDDGFPLGAWVLANRDRHREGSLRPEQAAALEALPGWEW